MVLFCLLSNFSLSATKRETRCSWLGLAGAACRGAGVGAVAPGPHFGRGAAGSSLPSPRMRQSGSQTWSCDCAGFRANTSSLSPPLLHLLHIKRKKGKKKKKEEAKCIPGCTARPARVKFSLTAASAWAVCDPPALLPCLWDQAVWVTPRMSGWRQG